MIAGGCASRADPPAGEAAVEPAETTNPTTRSRLAGEPFVSIGAKVTKVVDGDTIHVRIDGANVDETIRLIGIDTPETKKPNTPVECFGTEASTNLKTLLPTETRVRLNGDVEGRDKYDRLLAYVIREPDGLFVNRAQVEEGFAAPYRYPPNVAHADELSEAGRRAREGDRGLWSRCDGPHSTTAR